MERESFIFYRSFFDAVAKIKNKSAKLAAYEAIISFGLNGTLPTHLPYEADLVFTMARPQLEANYKRMIDGRKGAEHGIKGGRPKKDKNPDGDINKNPSGVTSKTANSNANVNANANVNEKENGNDIPSPIAVDISGYLQGIERKRKELAND